MTGRDRGLLFGVGLALALLASRWISAPGYMDAEYYFATGRELASGQGLQEPFLWNYLDEPAGLPHPSHSYWMPVPSWMVAAGIALFGPSFPGGRALFLIAAAVMPLVASQLAFSLTSDRRAAWASGLLALVPGFYSPYLLTTDSFSPYAVLGGLTLAALASRRPGVRSWIGAGALIGLCHLTRADGLLLLPLGAAAAWTAGERAAKRALALAVGYGVVVAPWLLRNLAAFGRLLPPGQARALWLTEYNDLFVYPATVLTPDRWLEQGWGAIVATRLAALGSNLTSLWAVNGLVFLLPLMALGAWRFRNHRLIRFALAYLALELLLMSFVFPYAGTRGGYFHSSVAAMPV
ncbi:MAG: glycosyltransferase family 39 protein, partial [Anaerolineales bacterium]